MKVRQMGKGSCRAALPLRATGLTISGHFINAQSTLFDKIGKNINQHLTNINQNFSK